MEPGLDKELRDIMSAIECPKDFKCYKREFTASEIGLEAFRLCSEKRPVVSERRCSSHKKRVRFHLQHYKMVLPKNDSKKGCSIGEF